MGTHEVKSVCRICAGACGVVATIDDDQRLTALRGDREHPLTAGFVCSKGLQSIEAMYSDQRLLRPLKRMPDGSYKELPLSVAMAEIADKLSVILDEDGGEAIGVFKGTQTWKNPTAHRMINAWLPALGSTRLFTTITIDQSAKQVTMCRMGYWDAGKPSLDQCDVMLVVGGNPIVSLAIPNFIIDPVKRLKKALARGMTLLVIDPRRSELAQRAHHFLQPKPGEDPTIIAGMLRIILANNWHDAEFCARYVAQLDALRAAVEPFTPAYVAQRAGIDAEALLALTRAFALENRRGIAVAGTGPSMAPHSNLADHLVETLNAICGRYLRPGDAIPNPGVQNPRRVPRAEVIAANRQWETGPKTSTGHGTLFGELMSGVLADEMLLQGPGRLRALFVNGGNPAVALPDQHKAVAGLKALDLLVAIEPYMTATARLAHYILPPRLQFERTDTAVSPHYESLIDVPFAQYVPAVVPPPAGAEVVDDWYPYWATASLLGRQIHLNGTALDMTKVPTTDDLLGILLRDAQIPFTELQQCTEGKIFDIAPNFVQPPRSESQARLQVMPDDVRNELAEVFAETPAENAQFPLRLIVRRLRGVMNSTGIGMAGSRRLHPYNAVFMHPHDVAEFGLTDGGEVTVAGEAGRVSGLVACDADLRPGVIAMSHCWGGLPGESPPYADVGAATSLLVRTDRHVETINAMPQMTALPVRVMAGWS